MGVRESSVCVVLAMLALVAGCGSGSDGIASRANPALPGAADAPTTPSPLPATPESTEPSVVMTATPIAESPAQDPTETAVVTPTADVPNPTVAIALTLPPVNTDEQVILFGAYEGDAVSSITLWGQDALTETAHVMIEPGEGSLYVILTSYNAMIWRFEGDVSRVHQIVLLGWAPEGVTGLPADRVVDLSGSISQMPPYFYSTDSPEAGALRDIVESALGRPIDVMSGSYTVATLSLPSATLVENPPSAIIPAGFDPGVYQLGLWYHPGGVVDITPAAVVSAAAVEPYEVAPVGFGVAQLVASGAIEPHDDYFYIARAIPRFPAALYGAESVTFVLGRGVPVPPGDPGHSCVITEETGAPIGDGPTCGLFQPPVTSCSLPNAAADQIVLFGAYEADAIATSTIAGPDEVTNTARVVIAPGITPLYITLTAYESIIWRFEGAIERIDRLVLVGYGVQGVTGVPPSLLTNLSGGTDCVGYFYDAQSPEGLAMRHAVETGIGRPVDVIGGAYTVGTLSLPAATAEPSAAPPVVFLELDPSVYVPPGFDPAVYQLHALLFKPGGLVDIDPALVISPTPAEPYDVLPEGFGLAQLVATGALEVRGSIFPFGEFYIARPIPRFPAGLYGALSVEFVLGRGVPLPAGSPGHSCVISEETGLPLTDSLPSCLPDAESITSDITFSVR